MTPTELIAAFESLAEAPDGVACLRELILQLAVRGRLVEQRPGDGSASDLVRRVLAEADGRKIRVEIVHESRKPFDAPTRWGWVHLGDAMDLINGRAFKPADWRTEGLRIVRIQNLNDPAAAYNHCDPAIDRRFCIESGCLLLSWSGTPGTSFGAFVWQGGLAALNQHIFRCQPRADAFAIHFLRLAINSRLNEMIARAHGGVGLRHITKGKLEGLWLPVPPLAEQHRIVARVEELMGLLDRLEAARAKREATRVAARDSVLAALREADSPAEVDAAWTRLAQRMDDLVCDPADIAPLRRTVLQLAVRGRLVRQDPRDEPASVLLARIATAKRQRALGGRITEREPGLVASEDLADLPASWVWCRLGDVLLDVEGGWSPAALGRPREGEEWGVLKVSACSWGRFLPNENKALEPGTVPREHLEVRLGDFLISRANTAELVARSVVVDACPPRLMLSDKTLRLKPAEGVVVTYLNLANLSDYSRVQYEAKASGTSASMKNVAQEVIRAVVIPLPPAAEQQRIVARHDELMALIDRLEARLTAGKAVHESFAAAAVHHLEA